MCHAPTLVQVSDAIAHAIDSPAEPKRAPEWHALHDKYTKELAAAKVCYFSPTCRPMHTLIWPAMTYEAQQIMQNVSSPALATKCCNLMLVQDLDLLMYGDSIFESLLGKQMGQSSADWADIAQVWTKHGNSKSMVLAISGANLLLEKLQRCESVSMGLQWTPEPHLWRGLMRCVDVKSKQMCMPCHR